jgi:hypothetical protein
MSTAAKSLIFTTVAALAVVAAQAQEPGKKPKTHAVIDPAKLPPPATQKGVTYAKDVRPLFEATCFRCHGEEKQKGGLRLDSLEAVLKGGEDGKVVIPGNSAKSLLVIGASRLDEEFEMPPRRRVRVLGEPLPPVASGPAGADGQTQADRATPPAPVGVNLPPVSRGPNGSTPASGNGNGGSGGAGGGAPSKPLTAEQVGLVRAWIEQGAK